LWDVIANASTAAVIYAGGGAPTGLVMDALTGDIFVADQTLNTVTRLSASNAWAATIVIPGGVLGQPRAAVPDCMGNVYVAGV
jgi:streptogramin lyase